MYTRILSTLTKDAVITEFLLEWGKAQTWPNIPQERYSQCINNKQAAFVFSRPTSEFISVSDTIPDFDAEETIITRHLLPNSYRLHEARRTEELLYAAETLVSLQDAKIETVINGIKHHLKYCKTNVAENLPITLQTTLREICTHTKRVLLNCAPRNHKKEAESTINGDDFYVAITDNFVEVYCVPVHCLEYIQERIICLYRIPTSNHPLFHDREQFRSSIVGATGHITPQHLQLAWEKQSSQSITDILGTSTKAPNVAFVDKFNNRRIRVPNIDAFWQQVLANTKQGRVNIKIGTSIIDCEVVTDLANISSGSFGIYKNVADVHTGTAGYIECNRRLNDNEQIWTIFETDSIQNASSHLHEQDRGIGVIVEVLPK